MKRLLLGLVLLGGCTSKTPYGECIGITDDENPLLEYKVSTRNLIWGTLGMGLMVPPVLVAFTQFKCPVAAKAVAK